MAEGTNSMESENYNSEDMDEESDDSREEEMVEGSDYEESGALGGYGSFTSFDMHLLQAFGSLGSGLRLLMNEPWELENPMLAQTLMEALQLDPETLASEAAARTANMARAAASNRATRAAAIAAARAVFYRVVTEQAPRQASGAQSWPTTTAATPADAAPSTAAQAQANPPEPAFASARVSQVVARSKVVVPETPATYTQAQPAPRDQQAASEGPSTACTVSRGLRPQERDATRPLAALLGQSHVFDFARPAGVSGMAFARPKRPVPAQAAASKAGPSTSRTMPQARTIKSGKALAKTRWVEPQNVVATAAAKARMAARRTPEPKVATAPDQQGADPWARTGGKRTKKSKHLGDECDSSEDEREPPEIPPSWRASKSPTRALGQVAPRPPVTPRPQVPSRHVLCLPPRNVTLLQERANKLVKYLMIKDYKKIPIKRSDMLRDVIREYDEHFPEIIERATYTLEKKFGIHLKEIDKEEHLYILICTRDSSARLMGKTKDTPRLSLLLVILGLIFMNGNRVCEAVLWDTLRKMGLRPGMRHPFLGDLRRLITEDFVKQKYLEYKKIPNSSPSEYEFRWGLRSHYETSKMRVLRFIAQYQNRDPQEWKAHFLEAMDEAFKSMDVEMAEEHARAQMRVQMNIGAEALVGRFSWDDIQVELLTWDEDGDFGDAWSRIPFAFWARYHQYILSSSRANRRAIWRAGSSSSSSSNSSSRSSSTSFGASTSNPDGPSTSSNIRARSTGRSDSSFFSWIQHR